MLETIESIRILHRFVSFTFHFYILGFGGVFLCEYSFSSTLIVRNEEEEKKTIQQTYRLATSTLASHIIMGTTMRRQERQQESQKDKEEEPRLIPSICMPCPYQIPQQYNELVRGGHEGCQCEDLE